MSNHNLKTDTVEQMYALVEDQKDQNKILQDYGNQHHLGYWDKPNLSSTEAAERLTQVMINKVTIQAGQRFCDLGCGGGHPAITLMQATGCCVDGITISQSQQEIAQHVAATAGMADQANFILGNALEMPCEDATYDGGWFFESIFHMGHSKALQEASRILKPGATLLIADITAQPTINQDLKALYEQYTFAFYIAKEEYPDLLDKAGFDLVEMDNVTEFVIAPSVANMKNMSKQYESEFTKYFESPEAKEGFRTYCNKLGIEYVEGEELKQWLQMHEQVCNHSEYILVTARKRETLLTD
ncbi:MAG: methyltransferase domain-containing protein [Cyanobacteria bacterium P01_F01_bin.150]